MADYDPPQGFIRVWDSNQGLFGGYALRRDWEGARQNGECSGGRDHPVQYPREVPQRFDEDSIPDFDL